MEVLHATGRSTLGDRRRGPSKPEDDYHEEAGEFYAEALKALGEGRAPKEPPPRE